MTKTALITGASSGIGRELAKVHAAKRGNLVIVARRIQELEDLKLELQETFGITVLVIQADLSKEGAAKEIFDKVTAENITIDYLINNAGFGGHGKFYQQKWEDQENMIKVNILALTALTHLFLPGMLERNSGRILNVASTAGFLPGPLQAVYYATKAYVLSFSQALAEELSDTEITVSALCPGPVKTEFAKVAHLEGAELLKGGVATADEVALMGYDAMTNGKLVRIDDPKLSFLLNWIVPLLPRKLVLKLSRKSMEK